MLCTSLKHCDSVDRAPGARQTHKQNVSLRNGPASQPTGCQQSPIVARSHLQHAQQCTPETAAALHSAAATGRPMVDLQGQLYCRHPCSRSRTRVAAAQACHMQLHDSPEEHPTEQQMHVGHTGHAATNGVSTTVVSIGAQEAGTEGDMQAYSDALLYAQQLQGQQQPKPKHQVLNVQSRQSRPVALDSLLYQMHQAHNQLQNSLLIGAGQKQQRRDAAALKSSQTRMTEFIHKVADPQALLQVLLQGDQQLNAIHLTAAAVALLRCAEQQERLLSDNQYRHKVKWCMKHFVRLMQSQLLDLDPRGLASLLHYLEKLGSCSPLLRADSLWGDVLHLSCSRLQLFTPRQLAMVVYAVARADPWVKDKPDRRWWAEYFQSSMQQMADFQPQSYANMVLAMGRLRRRPGPAWAASLYQATQDRLQHFTSQGLANLASGLAMMHVCGLPRPGHAWIEAFLEAAEQQLEDFTGQGLANTLWSLAKLGYCPPRSRLTALMAASHQLLHHSTALDLALIVYSFAALGVRPPEVWWTRFWSASAVVMGDAGSQALSNMFWGLGRLKKVPPKQWLLLFLSALQRELPNCTSQATANVLWAAGQLQMQHLPASWLAAIVERSYHTLPDSTPAELNITLFALQKLEHQPSLKWLDRFYATSQPLLPSFQGHHLTRVLFALGALFPRCPPPKEWSVAALAQVSARLSTMTAPNLCEMMWGVSELGMSPSRDLVTRYLSESAEKLHLMNASMLSKTLRTLVCFGHTPNTDWLILMVDESLYHLADMTPEELGDIVWGFGMLRFSPGPNWLSTAQHVVADQLPRFNARALLKFLQGLVGLRVQPEQQWLLGVGARVEQQLRDMSGEELLQLVQVLEQLKLGSMPVLVQQLMMRRLGAATGPEGTAVASVSPPAGFVCQAGQPALAVTGEVRAESNGQQQEKLQPRQRHQHAAVSPSASRHVAADTGDASKDHHNEASQQQAASGESNAAQLQDHAVTGKAAYPSTEVNGTASGMVLLPKPQMPRRPVVTPLPPALVAPA